MSKRKRKRKPTPRPSRERESSAPQEASTPTARKRNQVPLLIVAMVLILATVYVNWSRIQLDQMPEVAPFPVDVVTSRPLYKPSASDAPMFAKLDASYTGVNFVHPVLPDHPQAFLYFSSTASGGTAVGDVNGDGRPDLFIASGPESNRLYLQTETPFKFEDITSNAGVDGGDAWACGATMVDINADGWLDIYVANYDAPNQLFINRGDGTFKNMAADYGLNITDASLEATFADYDSDGDLDMYLVTYRYENPAGMPFDPPIVNRKGKRAIHPDFEKYYEITDDGIGYGTVGRSDGLLRNNGNGTFTNVTDAAGIHGAGHGQSATWWDYDQDGDVDLHVGNDFNDPDRLYRNNGNGTFTDVVRESVPHITWFSMGADTGDVNGDGLLDLLTADMSSTTHFKQKTTMGSMGDNIEFLSQAVPRQYMRNALLLNTGTPRFQEAAYLTGLDSTDWTWAVKLVDFDCDGLLDAFFTNGSVRSFTDSDRTLTLSQRMGKTEWQLYKDTEPLRERNLVFKNLGTLQFSNQSQEWGLDHLGVSMSAAHADFDGDGDLDLVVANLDEPISIYRNDVASGSRVTIRLHGRGGNRFGIGAKIELKSAGQRQVRELHPSRGFLASNQPVAQFGIGEAKEFDLTITWPDGTQQELTSLAANHHFEIAQPDDRAPMDEIADDRTTARPLFEAMAVSGVKHQENDFDDYALQPLLPHRMSRLGPALATADVDGDGDLDYFVGGAAEQAGRLLLFDNEQSRFVQADVADLNADAKHEDLGAIWFDLDADGDQDLLVTTGGNEQSLSAANYPLRLYLNDGQGVLKRDRARVPEMDVSGGPLCAGDFDQDGDVDIFVGGRQVPGKYPLPADSYLLVNENGTLIDGTDQNAKELRQLGMVTGALWTDFDQDHDLDLLLTTEWGPMVVMKNEAGRLRDATAEMGLSAYRGWWTGITSGDFDHDGDLDYVATNMGTNTKYHASDEKPFRLFYGDFEGTGERKLVEAEYENETLFPVRGKSCSTHAMPSLGEKFNTYKAFAAATLEEIYTQKCLDEAYECSANRLQSVVLINNGERGFHLEPLPPAAQLAPGFGCVVSDFTGDGIMDVFLAQNFFSPQPETGNMDGGLGCVLRGHGDGKFEAISVRDAGVVIPQDATAAVAADWTNDGQLDLLVATNNNDLRAFRGVGSPDAIQLRFTDAASTSDIAGTQVRIVSPGYPDQLIEISAGSGYLSQAAPQAFLRASSKAASRCEVTWPDGEKSVIQIDAGDKRIDVVRERQ